MMPSTVFTLAAMATARQYPLRSTSEQTQRLNKSVLSPPRSVPSGQSEPEVFSDTNRQLRYPAKLRLSAAVLRWCQSQPGCQLAPILKIMCMTDTGDQRIVSLWGHRPSIPSAADCDDLFLAMRDKIRSYSAMLSSMRATCSSKSSTHC